MKKNRLKVLLILAVLPWVGACKKSKNEVGSKAPIESYHTDSLTGKQHLSIVNIPVEIPMAEIERQLNSQLKELLYEDNDPDNNGGDNLLIKVWKKSSPKIEARGDVFNITMPLKIWAKAGYKFNQFGIELQDFRETEFEIDVKFATKLALGSDWKVNTLTSANGFDWITKPVLRFGPIEIPLASIVGDIIDQQQGQLATMVDREVKDKIDIKPFVQQAWTWMQNPIQLSKQYDTWLKIMPTEVIMTPFVGLGNRTRASLGIKAYTQTVIGQKPASTPNTTVPNLSIVSQVPDDFQVGLSGEISHQYATQILTKELVGQKYSFKEGKYNVEVTAIDLYGSGENLVIKAGLKGSINGSVYLKGKPYYDPATQTLSLQNLDYDLDTKNKLFKTANWLMQGKFTRMMQESFRLPVSAQIDEARKIIQTGLTNNHVAKGITLNGQLADIKPDKVYITPNSIVAVVLATGRVDVKIDGL
ncbi:MAG: DUF4403 family protein [Bacteroidota bacterium]